MRTLSESFVAKGLVPILSACLALFVCPALNASMVNVDFNTPSAHPTLGTYSGAAQLGAPGDLWNGVNIEDNNTIAGSGLLALFDSNGQSTAFTLSIAASSDSCCYPNAVGWDPFNADSLNYGNLMADMSQGSGVNFTIYGLAPGEYDLWIYTPFGLGDMTANLDSRASLPYDQSDRLLSTHSQLLQPVVLLDGVLNVSSSHRVSGFQLAITSPTPEPSTTVLFSLTMALWYAKRQLQRYNAKPMMTTGTSS